MTKRDLNTIIEQWLAGSEEAMKTFNSLTRMKHYGPALFFLHLAVEKGVKALIVKRTKEHAPYSHNLIYLMGCGGVKLTEQQLKELEILTSFNITGRYPEEKNEFYRIANKEVASKWHSVAKKYLALVRAQF